MHIFNVKTEQKYKDSLKETLKVSNKNAFRLGGRRGGLTSKIAKTIARRHKQGFYYESRANSAAPSD